MIKYVDSSTVFQEVPGEVSLALSISNCPLRCHYCHSAHLRKDIGIPLTTDVLQSLLDSTRSTHTNEYTITCVLFFGGDQHEELPLLLSYCHAQGLKTCLYTGRSEVPSNISNELDYLKVGAYIEKLGDLSKPTTNQRLYRLSDNTDLTNLFWSN